MRLVFWPLRGMPRMLAHPDSAAQNNKLDKSSQRSHSISIAAGRVPGKADSRG